MRSFLLLALATPLLALGASRTTLSSSDGTKVSAIVSGTGGSCAVLVHGDQRTAADWAPSAGQLVERGFRVVALDLRGHGETGGPLDETTYSSMPQDVSAAVAHLAERGCDQEEVNAIDQKYLGHIDAEIEALKSGTNPTSPH